MTDLQLRIKVAEAAADGPAIQWLPDVVVMQAKHTHSLTLYKIWEVYENAMSWLYPEGKYTAHEYLLFDNLAQGLWDWAERERKAELR